MDNSALRRTMYAKRLLGFAGKAIAFLAFIILSPLAHAQYVGGFSPGQAPATKVEKGSLTTGAVAGNVNLFTGTLDLSYGFGNVATLSGLGFPLTLNYNSTALVAFDQEQTAGIPYGEGWSLAQGSITVENVAFQFIPGQDGIPLDVNGNRLYNKDQARTIGELYFVNPMLTLPGGASGRLIYKYPHPERAGVAVYVLESFNSYVEAYFDGQKWEVVTDDGTIYEFATPHYQWRNPTGTTAHLGTMEVESSTPRRQVGKWLLSRISNPNHPQSQRVDFGYHFLGKFDYHKELRQAEVQRFVDTYDWKPDTIVRFDTTWNYLNGTYTVQPETLIVVPLNPSFTFVDVHQEVFLESVTALDRDGLIHSRVELKYKSLRPEQEFSLLERNRGKFLELSDTSVHRLDSLFSKKLVWEQSVSAGFSGDWRRYQHPAAYQFAHTERVRGIHPNDPFAAKYNFGATANPYLVPNAYYHASKLFSGATQPAGIDFTHSVLETPRINLAELPSGDLYELSAEIETPFGKDINFDLEIVSGAKRGFGSVTPKPNPTFGGWEFRAIDPFLAHGLANYYDDKGFSVFSTHDRIVKWNPEYGNGFSSGITTSNLFRMPNLPSEFEGFHLRVGPGSDNLNYDQSSTSNPNLGYPGYFENHPVGGALEENRNMHRSRWFGTGAPLQAQFREEFYNIPIGSNITKGSQAFRDLYWYWPMNTTISGFNLLQSYGPSQPTALTIEKLLPSPSGNYNSALDNIGAAHAQAQDSRLESVNLYRIAKNPWMLDSVIFYTSSGQYGKPGLVPTACYQLDYDLAQVQILNNINPLGADKNLAADYKTVNGVQQYRNIIQLSKIERLEVDSTGNIYRLAANPTTHFFYREDNPATKLMVETYLVDSVVNELGGRQHFVYDADQQDTLRINVSNQLFGQDKSYDLIGQGEIYEQRIRVKEIQTRDKNTVRRETYVYENPVKFYEGYMLDPHFQNPMSSRPAMIWKKGFGKTTVYRPFLDGPLRAKTEYFHRVSTGTWADTLLFGRLVLTRDYDEAHQLLSENKTHFKVTRGYPSGFVFPGTNGKFAYGLPIRDLNNFVYNYDAAYVFGSENGKRMDSWFVRTDSSTSIEYDPITGNSISSGVKFTHYDWEFDIVAKPGNADLDRFDTDDDYENMYQSSGPPVDWFNTEVYQDNANGGFSDWHEPSWQLASATTTNSGMPGAWNKEEYFYLYDIAPFVKHSGFPIQITNRLDEAMRPFHLSQEYQIRSTPYEIKATTFDGNPRGKPHSVSSYFWFDVFRDVNPDYVLEIDSTNYGRRCVGIPTDSIRLVKYDLGPGGQTAMNRMACEFADDPRYVQAVVTVGGVLDTLWYYFPIDSVSKITTAEFDALALTFTGPGGYAQGPKSEIVYFGDLPLKGGGSINASQILTATRNYGKECHVTSVVSEYSKKKAVLYIDEAKQAALDSAYKSIVTSSDSTSEPPRREIMADVLKNQFFLRAIYSQADSNRVAQARYPYQHNSTTPSLHNIFDTTQVNIGTTNGTPYRFEFEPLYPTIRTYYVYKRNMYGQVVHDEDVRHLQTYYEYDKPEFRGFWDLCGRPHQTIAWSHPFKPLSFTLSDDDDIEQTTVFSYYRDGSIQSVVLPNGETSNHLYDGQKRLTSLSLNGKVREGYAYHQWDNDLNKSWQQRTAENYVETVSQQTSVREIVMRDFVDPMGRSVQTVKGHLEGIGYRKVFAGEQEYDAWGRVVKTHRPYVKPLAGNMGYDPAVPNLAFAESKYENSRRSRTLKSATFGRAISGTKVREADYRVIPLSQCISETGMTAGEYHQIFPRLLPAPFLVGPPATTSNILVHKTTSEDEDGKQAISYTTSTGYEFASLRFTDIARTEKVLTLFVPDGRGNTRKVIHPNKLETTSQYNFQGWPYLTTTPDAGTKKVMYNQAGDVVVWQDENLREQGRFYYFDIDRMGRVYREKTLNLNAGQFGGSGTLTNPGAIDFYEPLVYQNTGATTFHSIHTIMDMETG